MVTAGLLHQRSDVCVRQKLHLMWHLQRLVILYLRSKVNGESHVSFSHDVPDKEGLEFGKEGIFWISWAFHVRCYQELARRALEDRWPAAMKKKTAYRLSSECVNKGILLPVGRALLTAYLTSPATRVQLASTRLSKTSLPIAPAVPQRHKDNLCSSGTFSTGYWLTPRIMVT